MIGNFEVNHAAVKISACAWCLPGNTVFLLHPELPRYPVSHTICQTCKQTFLQALQGAKTISQQKNLK